VLGSEIVLVIQRNQCDPVPLSDVAISSIERFDVSTGCRGLRGRTPKERGEVEAVVLMRGEVRLDR
jgi:hypothetical protein